MENIPSSNSPLRDKKILFAGAAAFGGLISGLIATTFFDLNNAFLSWVVGGALDAALIGAFIVYAQNFYQTKSLIISSGLKTAIKKGLIIGSTGGVVALISMYIFGSGNFGRIIGWGISGGVAGYVVSTQVPNLRLSTAIAAGAIGGIAGCLFMLMDFGYTIGVMITGAAIGLMVAIAEVAFRKNWLNIDVFNQVLGGGLNLQKPVNQYTLTLGRDAIKVGYADGMDIKINSSESKSLAHAASIYLEGNDVIFCNLGNGEKTKLSAGKPFRFAECEIKTGI